MTTLIEVFTGDSGDDINFTLHDANDAVIDITGATLLFKAQKETGTALSFSGSMTIVSASAGTCKYTTAADDFDEEGRYYAEIQITFSGGQVLTLGDIVVNAKPQLPRLI